MDDESEVSRLSNNSAIKRSGSILSSPQRKKTASMPEKDYPSSTGPTSDGAFHARWLIESSVCARVLGPSGKRLKHLKESTQEPNFHVRISPKVFDAEYRVFKGYGSAMGISKAAGLYVRFIYEEPEDQLSNPNSSKYDLKLLIPKDHAEAFAGENEENLREIEQRSNAVICLEERGMPYSTERCLHIYGPADAIQIAIYFTLETLKKVERATRDSINKAAWRLFDPKMGVALTFCNGTASDAVPRPWVPMQNGFTPNTSTIDRITTSQESSPAPVVPSKTLLLPPLQENPHIPQSILTAYDIARDSKRSKLRQIVQLGSKLERSETERIALAENIRRVTDCNITEGAHDHNRNFEDDDELDEHVSFVIEGAPEENTLALFLIYRFLTKNKR